MMYPKPKHKKKSKHKVNGPVAGCCRMCGAPATQKHEIFHDGTSMTRNLCIDEGWQIEVCAKCHDMIHRNRTIDLSLMNDLLYKILSERNWDLMEFRQKTGITTDFEGGKL